MHREPLYVVWEYDSAVRAAFASYGGRPYYVEQVWEESGFVSAYTLKPVTLDLVEKARQARAIMSGWERERACGRADHRFRPDMPGNDARYWALFTEVSAVLRAIAPLRDNVSARIFALECSADSEQQAENDLYIEWDTVE